MKQVTTKELREFLMKYLREKKKISERSCNHYNSVIRFIYDVVLDMPINQKQVPMYKKKRKLPKILSNEEQCRIKELGYHEDVCDECGYKKISYNSCRNRHCPKCQSIARKKWIYDREFF